MARPDAKAQIMTRFGSRTRFQWIFALPLVLSVSFFFILPYGASLTPLAGGGEAISIFKNSAFLSITFFTLKQSFFSVLVSLLLGLPGALFAGSGKSRFSPLFRIIFSIPFAVPSILAVMGFVLFFGNSGWVNTFLKFITGSTEGPIRILYKPEAIILAHGFFNFPLVIRLVGDGIARAKKSYASAAANLGASPFMTSLTVILPLSLPAILSSILLVFLYSFTSFTVVLVLGGGPASTTLAVEIYRHARIFLNYRNAGVLALAETLIAVSVFCAYIFFGRKSGQIKSEIEEQYPDIKVYSSGIKILVLIYVTLIGIFILGPLVSVILESFLFQNSRSALPAFGFRWWHMVDTWLPALFRSLLLALLSSLLSCLLAISAAQSIKISEKKRNNILSGFIRFCASAPVVSSGIVLGLGWLILYGRRSSPLVLILLHGIMALPFSFNSIYEGFRSIPDNTLDAASVLGAGHFRSLITVTLPLSRGRIRSAWAFAAALSLGEINTVIMLGMENFETLPLYIYRAMGAYRYGTACAAGTLLILCCTACFLFSEYAAGKTSS